MLCFGMLRYDLLCYEFYYVMSLCYVLLCMHVCVYLCHVCMCVYVCVYIL